jgi:hypothetical protein
VTLATAIVAALAFLAGDPLPGAAGAVPPPVAQVAADCRTPIYASDVVVCGDPTLLRLDNRMREMLGRGGPEIGGQEGSLVESQEAWFRRRSLCAFSVQQAACLEAAYADWPYSTRCRVPRKVQVPAIPCLFVPTHHGVPSLSASNRRARRQYYSGIPGDGCWRSRLSQEETATGLRTFATSLQ